MLKNVSTSGQQKLANARVSIIGLGGLGCQLAVCLTRAGINNLQLIDFDTIALHNLHRQILYTNSDISKYKVAIASAKLIAHNPDLNCEIVTAKISENHLYNYNPDIVVDCGDNSSSWQQLHNYCSARQTPLIYARAAQYFGNIAKFDYQTATTACLYCLESDQQSNSTNTNSCAKLGVMATTVITIGSIQADFVIKQLLNNSFGDSTLHLIDFNSSGIAIDKINGITIDKMLIPKQNSCKQCSFKNN